MKKIVLSAGLVASVMVFGGCSKNEVILGNYDSSTLKSDYEQVDVGFNNSINLILGNILSTESNKHIAGIGYVNVSQNLHFEKINDKINVHESVSVTNLDKYSPRESIKLFSRVRSLDAKKCSTGSSSYTDNTIKTVTLDVEKIQLSPSSERVNTKDFKRGYESSVDVCVDDTEEVGTKDILQVKTRFKYFEPVLLGQFYK